MWWLWEKETIQIFYFSRMFVKSELGMNVMYPWVFCIINLFSKKNLLLNVTMIIEGLI